MRGESPPKPRENETHPWECKVGQEEQFHASVAAVSSEDFVGKKVPLCACRGVVVVWTLYSLSAT